MRCVDKYGREVDIENNDCGDMPSCPICGHYNALLQYVHEYKCRDCNSVFKMKPKPAERKLITAMLELYGDNLKGFEDEILKRLNREVASLVYHGVGDFTMTQNGYCALNVLHSKMDKEVEDV